jgi:hypothetical protein
MEMKKTKFLVTTVSAVLAAPFAFVVVTHPTAPPPDAPSKLPLLAAQSLSTGSVGLSNGMIFDTVRGHGISVAPRVDQHPRPAFIAPSPWIMV